MVRFNLETLKQYTNISIWLDDDDTRVVPTDYIHCYSVNETIEVIRYCESNGIAINMLDLDHDLGMYAEDGGDAIKLLDWIDETDRRFNFHLHTMNPVGRQNMQLAIDHIMRK